MANLPKGISEIAGAVGAFFSLTRANRRREHLQRSIALYNELKPHSDLVEAQKRVKEVIKIESQHLLDVVEPKPHQKRDWSEFIIGIILTIFLVWLMWYLVRYRSDWWIPLIELFMFFIIIPGFIKSTLKAFSLKDKQTNTKGVGLK